MEMKPNKEFEAWYSSRGYSQHCAWHPERNEYTAMSPKQFAWEAWKAGQKTIPNNCVLMPKIPTKRILSAWPDSYSTYNIYKAFIEAAPKRKLVLKRIL
jgi:hypothetical protein